MFDELVAFQAEAGTGGRMSEYRRLIGAGCGGVPPSEVDQVLGMLLEVRCPAVNCCLILIVYRLLNPRNLVLHQMHGTAQNRCQLDSSCTCPNAKYYAC